ncbi:MAG: SDR family oxidoreductase [Proteobacteria bacterium]|nr:SDR family oxidoreductase [Pseudomonadota bacterium]
MTKSAPQGSGADFSLAGRVVVITGGAGLLGVRHAEAIAAAGGTPVIADRRGSEADAAAAAIASAFGVPTLGAAVDVTSEASVRALLDSVMTRFGRVDALVNNAANNPKVEDGAHAFSRLEEFPLDQWNADIAVGLTGAFLCAKVFGTAMAAAGRGVIVNISSEYGIIAPDQRLYAVEGKPEAQQPKKPVSYTAVKAGLHGLTLYLATYWADRGVRANTITLGGVENGQPAEFLARAASRIPMGRMAQPTDFQGALVWLCSDASSFVNGANVVVDGGKSVW